MRAMTPETQDRYARIPGWTLETIDAWVENARPTGHFVTAVLENNLAEAFARADQWNRAAMHDIVKYVWNECPSGCWGSPAIVQNWAKLKREERGALQR